MPPPPPPHRLCYTIKLPQRSAILMLYGHRVASSAVGRMTFVGMDVRGGLDRSRENNVRLGDEPKCWARNAYSFSRRVFMQTERGQRISLACTGCTMELYCASKSWVSSCQSWTVMTVHRCTEKNFVWHDYARGFFFPRSDTIMQCYYSHGKLQITRCKNTANFKATSDFYIRIVISPVFYY